MAVPEALVDAESAPHWFPVQPAPDKAHLTPLFCVSFVTAAVNCAFPEVTTEALLAFRFNATAGGGGVVVPEGVLAQPASTKARAASAVMTQQKLRPENLDMSRKPRGWTPQNRILAHLAHLGDSWRKQCRQIINPLILRITDAG